MIDDIERSTMLAPIEDQERGLELKGPIWRAPGLKAVLSQLPFLRGQPAAVRGRCCWLAGLDTAAAAAVSCVQVPGRACPTTLLRAVDIQR